MREIKFRAWDKKANKFRRVSDVGWYRAETGKTNISGVIVTLDDGRDQFLPIEDIELVEFTGLKDKNGEEIYEGDLFMCHYAKDGCKEQPMEVIYHKESAAFRFKRRGICQQIEVIQDVYHHAGWRGEIIGNIYNNPELLEA
jgi:uncharacterized phage protein (TIGR01671 family)